MSSDSNKDVVKDEAFACLTMLVLENELVSEPISKLLELTPYSLEQFKKWVEDKVYGNPKAYPHKPLSDKVIQYWKILLNNICGTVRGNYFSINLLHQCGLKHTFMHGYFRVYTFVRGAFEIKLHVALHARDPSMIRVDKIDIHRDQQEVDWSDWSLESLEEYIFDILQDNTLQPDAVLRDQWNTLLDFAPAITAMSVKFLTNAGIRFEPETNQHMHIHAGGYKLFLRVNPVTPPDTVNIVFATVTKDGSSEPLTFVTSHLSFENHLRECLCFMYFHLFGDRPKSDVGRAANNNPPSSLDNTLLTGGINSWMYRGIQSLDPRGVNNPSQPLYQETPKQPESFIHRQRFMQQRFAVPTSKDFFGTWTADSPHTESATDWDKMQPLVFALRECIIQNTSIDDWWVECQKFMQRDSSIPSIPPIKIHWDANNRPYWLRISRGTLGETFITSLHESRNNNREPRLITHYGTLDKTEFYNLLATFIKHQLFVSIPLLPTLPSGGAFRVEPEQTPEPTRRARIVSRNPVRANPPVPDPLPDAEQENTSSDDEWARKAQQRLCNLIEDKVGYRALTFRNVLLGITKHRQTKVLLRKFLVLLDLSTRCRYCIDNNGDVRRMIVGVTHAVIIEVDAKVSTIQASLHSFTSDDESRNGVLNNKPVETVITIKNVLIMLRNLYMQFDLGKKDRETFMHVNQVVGVTEDFPEPEQQSDPMVNQQEVVTYTNLEITQKMSCMVTCSVAERKAKLREFLLALQSPRDSWFDDEWVHSWFVELGKQFMCDPTPVNGVYPFIILGKDHAVRINKPIGSSPVITVDVLDIYFSGENHAAEYLRIPSKDSAVVNATFQDVILRIYTVYWYACNAENHADEEVHDHLKRILNLPDDCIFTPLV